MYHSLLKRFQGGLLGLRLGEGLGRAQGIPYSQELLPAYSEEILDWSRIAGVMGESLIEKGNVEPQDCLNRLHNHAPDLLTWQQQGNDAQVTIATFPIMLFCHETPGRLQEQLSLAGSIWQKADQSPENIGLWGQIITLILREKLDKYHIIPQILENFPALNISFRAQLQKVQASLVRGDGLHQVVHYLKIEDTPEIAIMTLALYCFACTPEDFYLCLGRALQAHYYPTITGALTGAIAGVYNSIQGIPLNWRLTCPHTSDCLSQGERLFAAWLGLYNLPKHHPLPPVTVASPRLLQPRATPPVISQRNLP